MTVTKESLRQALGDWTPDGPPPWQAKATVINAARFVERLLPEKCPCGINEGFLDPCPRCQDTGQLWDEGLVEAVAEALCKFYETDASDDPEFHVEARAVLAALTQEVGA